MAKKVTRADIKEAIKKLLSIEINLPIKREFLRILIYKLTEAGYSDKYNVPLKTEKAIKFLRQRKRKELVHEHITERKEIVNKLLEKKNNSQNIEKILDSAVCCVVTKEEHKKLKKTGEKGWMRYKKAKIKVYNTKDNGKEIPFENLRSYKKIFG